MCAKGEEIQTTVEFVMEGIVGKKGQIVLQKIDTISKAVTYWQG